jgi:hypothetical protein
LATLRSSLGRCAPAPGKGEIKKEKAQADADESQRLKSLQAPDASITAGFGMTESDARFIKKMETAKSNPTSILA